jgi:hypothetical protein
MEKEYGSLLENRTCIFTDLPDGKKAVKNKWVLKAKESSDTSTVQYKARLVARGFT